MKQTQRVNQGFTLIELMVVVAIIGILAAIAIPNFMKFQARSKQGEAKSNLKSWFISERAYLQEKDVYSEDIKQIGYSPERGNRYAYYFSPACAMGYENRSAAALSSGPRADCITVDTAKHTGAVMNPAAATVSITKKGVGDDAKHPGLGGTCPGCNIDAYAAGNIDNEATGFDTWYVSTVDSEITPKCGGGMANQAAPAGVPFLVYNDVDCDS